MQEFNFKKSVVLYILIFAVLGVLFYDMKTDKSDFKDGGQNSGVVPESYDYSYGNIKRKPQKSEVSYNDIDLRDPVKQVSRTTQVKNSAEQPALQQNSRAYNVSKQETRGELPHEKQNAGAYNTHETDMPVDLPYRKVYISVNQPSSLSYLSREQVFAIRKNFVKKSIFGNINYDPQGYALGQIESNKPWMSVNRCRVNKSEANIDGASEESKDLNNPSVLISVDWPMRGNYSDPRLCKDPLLPTKIIYYPDINLVDVYYKLFIPENSWFLLKGLNARDFGYQYAYLDKSKSKNPLGFMNPNNISQGVVELRDFLHTGGSCGVEGGCNNGSPFQPQLQMKYIYEDTLTPHVMYFKMWKEHPASVNDNPDFSERIIILRQ